MNCTIFAKMAAATSKEVGPSFKAEVFQKALAKAKRWAKAAYGTADMQMYVDECGYSLLHYYRETEARITKTFNREVIKRASSLP